MQKYSKSSRLTLLTAIVTLLAIFTVWFFKAYYCNYPARETAYDKNGHPLKLRQVVMVFRHGMRTPSEHIFTLNWKQVHYPDGYGQLTQVGKSQMYEMGKSMRRRYHDFITPHSSYMSDDVVAVSTNMDRCTQSAGLLLAGLYPPEGRQIWNRKFRWQPVPVITSTPDKAYILVAGPSSCPLYYKLLNLTNARSEKSEKLFAYFSKYVNFSDDESMKIRQLFVASDTVVSEVKMNIPQPSWIREIYSDLVMKFLSDNFSYMSNNYQLQRLFSGTLLADIVRQMRKVVSNNDSSSKIYLYSGHDISISSLLNSLGLSAFLVPDYGASVIFELYSSSRNEYYVKVLYNEDTSFSKIKTQHLPRCDQLCPLDEFVSILTPLSMTEDEWKKECQSIE